MNFIDYTENKKAGLCEIIKAGGGYAFATKRWDSRTGEVKDPEIHAVSFEMIENRKIILQNEIDSINLIIADIESL